MGALTPRYSFVLNPHARERFTRCPRCEASTRIRKIPLVIHVDSVGLVLLGKTCRLCVVCEMLIAHQAELERLIDALGERQGGKREYLVLGTLEIRTWRRGLSGGVTVEELTDHMSDFKDYMRIDYTPAGWYRSDETAR
jgi:hypothetical protein